MKVIIFIRFRLDDRRCWSKKMSFRSKCLRKIYEQKKLTSFLVIATRLKLNNLFNLPFLKETCENMGGPLPPNKYGHRARRIYADLSADRADPSRLFDVFSNAQALIIRQQIEDCVLLVNFFFLSATSAKTAMNFMMAELPDSVTPHFGPSFLTIPCYSPLL